MASNTDHLPLLLLLPVLCLLHIPAVIIVVSRELTVEWETLERDPDPVYQSSGNDDKMDDPEHFDPGHEDRVTVLHSNFDGSRLLTGSLDHRIKVWLLKRDSNEKTLHETFTPHDGYIVAAKFTDPTVGSYIGTVGADLCCKIWMEDINHAPNSGRRYLNIATIQSTTRVSFTSFDFRTHDRSYTYLALVDRQGLLSIYEPTDPDNLSEWTLLDQLHVCSPVPNRGDETSFRLSFDPNTTPLSYMNSLSDDREQLGLIVSSLKEVKVYHSTADANIPAANGPNENGASHRLTFHECLRLPAHSDLVRNISWAQCNIRGVERFASCCKDGTIRVFEVGIAPASEKTTSASSSSQPATQRGEKAGKGTSSRSTSNLTSAITGRPGASTTTSSNNTPTLSRSAKSFTFPFIYQIEHISTLSAHGDAWVVTFDRQGNTLMTGGNDGVTRLWKKSIVDGKWLVFAERSVVEEDEDGEE